MCLSVFLGSDTELPLVEWNVEQPGFNVSVLTPNEEVARKWLHQRYVYALGAHTHCGCGFQRNEDNAPEDVAASRQGLSDYVAAASLRGRVDLYVCWNAELMDELTGEVTVQASALVMDESWIQEGALTHIVKP
jgi:hypothetical protein